MSRLQLLIYFSFHFLV